MSALPPLPPLLAANPRLDQWVRFPSHGQVTVSTGRVEIGQGVLTAMLQIAADELDVAPDRILLSGGGVRNGLLWRLLEQQTPGVPVGRTDEAGVPAGARKAMSFGVLAALTLDGMGGNAPSATGAAGPRLLGSLTPGSSANWSRCLGWMGARFPAPDGVD